MEEKEEEKRKEVKREVGVETIRTISCITTLAMEVITDMQASGIATDTLLCMEWMLDN